MSKVLIVTSSLRAKSNSDIVARQIEKGAKETGKEVEVVSLKGKTIKFCIGCLNCQKTRKCVLQDDMKDLLESVKSANSIVFVTPIYFYEMSGQLKTFLDRTNPLYGSKFDFKNIYLATVSADDDPLTPTRAINGLKGWIDCFDGVKLVDSIFFGGNNNPSEIENSSSELARALEFGRRII